MKKLSMIVAAFAALCSSVSTAQPVLYSFDVLTEVNMDGTYPSLTGVLRNGSTPTTVTFRDQTNGDFRYVVNRCVPIFLTMIEKPGRYYLKVTIDSEVFAVQLISCALELRS